MAQLLHKNLLMIPIIVVAIGLLPLNSDFYVLVRLVVCLFGAVAFVSLPESYKLEKVVFLILAIVYNPIFPIHFGSRIIWLPINLITIWFFWKLRVQLEEYDQ
jgi:hypothetical protein